MRKNAQEIQPHEAKYLPDIDAVGNERNQADFPTALRAQQREYIVYRAIKPAPGHGLRFRVKARALAGFAQHLP